MKIGQPSDHSVATTQTSQPAAAKAASQEAAQAARSERRAPAAGVTVTKTAALDKSSAANDVDSEKVEAVRKAIADGSYSVNAEAIADKLLASAREMLQRTSN